MMVLLTEIRKICFFLEGGSELRGRFRCANFENPLDTLNGDAKSRAGWKGSGER